MYRGAEIALRQIKVGAGVEGESLGVALQRLKTQGYRACIF